MASIVVVAAVLVAIGIRKQIKKRRTCAIEKDLWDSEDDQSTVTLEAKPKVAGRERSRTPNRRKIASLLHIRERGRRGDSKDNHEPRLDEEMTLAG